MMISGDLASVGHDNGLLVMHLECRLPLPPDRVRRALAGFEQREGDVGFNDGRAVADAIRWEVGDDVGGSRLSFTTWIDGADVRAAAVTGAEDHARFERLVEMIDGSRGAGIEHDEDADSSVLTDRYIVAFAEALADTD